MLTGSFGRLSILLNPLFFGFVLIGREGWSEARHTCSTVGAHPNPMIRLGDSLGEASVDTGTPVAGRFVAGARPKSQ